MAIFVGPLQRVRPRNGILCLVVVVVLVVVVPVFVVLAVADASNKRLPSCGVSDRLRSVEATCALALHTYSSASYTNT